MFTRRIAKVSANPKGEEGFSLVELIVVIVVLAILAAVAIPLFADIQNEAEKSVGKTAVADFATEGTVHIVLTNSPYTGPTSGQAAGLPNWKFSTTGGSSVDSLCVHAQHLTLGFQYQSGIGCP